MKVFIANRLCTILDYSVRSQWRHVRTDENPADMPTRTATVKHLIRSELWNWGPQFLTRPESQWKLAPGVQETDEALTEVKELERTLDKLHLQNQPQQPDILGEWLRTIWGKYSLPGKGFNIAAYCYKAICFWKIRRKTELELLSPRAAPSSEIDLQRLRNECLQAMLIQEQQRHLSDLRHNLVKRLPVKGRYACWRPFVDNYGLIRINGRIGHVSYLSYDQRHPVLLTKSMPMAAELGTLTHHEVLKHTGGPRQLLLALRKYYWIENGLTLAKQVLRDCSICQVHKIHDIPYQTAPLHASRHAAVRTFSHIGIDMFGPMEVKCGRGQKRAKRYGIIFTCCFTRAINVEITSDASAHTCFMAFRRHAAIYGQPLEVNSDRGTNLLHVRSTLAEMHTAWNDAQPQIKQHYPDIKWTVNPPRTPSFGGHFESLIKTLKGAFKTLVRWPKYSLTDEELQTAIKESAAMANMRPLTELSEDPRDLVPLSPSDFLNAPVLNIVPNWTEKNFFKGLKTDLDALRQDMWERMRQEVLTNFQKVKHTQTSEPLYVGEIVLLRTQEWRADRWPLAVVIELKPGDDGEIRVVKLRYSADGEKGIVQKEGIHSVKNLYRMKLPKVTRADRLL